MRQSFVLTLDVGAGYNLTFRLIHTLTLLKNILSVPFIGYGYRIRPLGFVDDMPFSTFDMESNIFIQDIYDFGIIIGTITIIWFLHSTFSGLKQQKKYNYATCLSWLGLLIASLSNISFTFPLFLVPITFYAWESWKLIDIKYGYLTV